MGTGGHNSFLTHGKLTQGANFDHFTEHAVTQCILPDDLKLILGAWCQVVDGDLSASWWRNRYLRPVRHIRFPVPETRENRREISTRAKRSASEKMRIQKAKYEKNREFCDVKRVSGVLRRLSNILSFLPGINENVVYDALFG